MKNIHILPTDKPSRVYKNLLTDKLFILENSFMDVSECNREYQNIYITNSEEINQQTEPCWCINTIKNTWDDDLIYYQGSMPQYHYVGFKKIILTTDQDLIKDNVQAIDDEFLKWFVKNPSCTGVEVRQIEDELISPKNPKIRFNALQDPPSFISANSLNDMILTYKYKIIIQKEKPKQEILENSIKLLVNKWQQQQINYETLAEHYIDDQHNNRKFTYKAMATRDYWKELLKLIENK